MCGTPLSVSGFIIGRGLHLLFKIPQGVSSAVHNIYPEGYLSRGDWTLEELAYRLGQVTVKGAPLIQRDHPVYAGQAHT
jgi:hypothetical protein